MPLLFAYGFLMTWLILEPVTRPTCPVYEWQCPGTEICIPVEKVCDGVSSDCPGGGDEGDIRCGKYILLCIP